MRRAVITTISLALLVGVVPLAWGSSAARKPALRFAAHAPVKIKGTQFRAGERVRVTLTLNGGTRAKRTRATQVGSFGVTFWAARVTDRCNSDVFARAEGARGSVATAKLPQLQCPPALAPPTP